MKSFNPVSLTHSKYIFFTGKGGVGKTSTACATAVHLADSGKKILLVSTDPASNLQDVFNVSITNSFTHLQEVPNLVVLNLDPLKAAEEYKERVIAPYRGKLPETVIDSMSEQLSGSCTVEIAAFNEFSNLLTDAEIQDAYDHILFDTAPTGHTLRMLQLPSAWTGFISENTHGASCLGQLSGLEAKKDVYRKAMETLSDPQKTTLVLVARPENAPLAEADRASRELRDIGVENQTLIINGVLSHFDDAISQEIYDHQCQALDQMPELLKRLEQSQIPLRAYNVMGVEKVRAFLESHEAIFDNVMEKTEELMNLDHVIQDLVTKNKKVIFTMGKGGVGKTSIAAKIALGFLERGKKVHLTTTDPAAHLKWVAEEQNGLTMSHIDESVELENYREEVLGKARKEMSEEDLAYIEEDLRSPCTQEIAVFRAFAEVVDKADHDIVVVDTAPTGHTLLLLDATQSYHREIQRSQGDIPESVKRLLPRLRDPQETEVVIVSLAEATPFYEAKRLEDDLKRAGIYTNWWVINASLYATQTSNAFLKAKGSHELEWIRRITDHARGSAAVIEWAPQSWRMNESDIS